MKKYIFHNKLQFVFLVFFKVLNTTVFLYFSILIKNIINIALEKSHGADIIKYIVVGIIYSLVLVGCYMAVASLHSVYMNRAVSLLKNDYLKKLFEFPYEKITEKESATYISTLTNDITMVRNGYLEQIFASMDSIISIVLSFGYVFTINHRIAFFVLGGAAILPLFPILMEKKLFAADEALSKANEDYISELKGVLSGVEIIKTFGASHTMLNRVDASISRVRKQCIRNDVLSIILSSLSTTVTNIIKIGLVLLGVYYVLKGELDIGSVTALFVLSSSFYNPVMSLCYQIGNIMGTKSIVKKIEEVLGANIEHKAVEDNVKLDDKHKITKLQFEDVSYAYTDERDVLKKVNLQLEMGKKYLIIGESGSGKTTLLKLLLKMYSNYSGKITLDDNDYKTIGEEYIYEKIAYAQQKTYIFNGSLRENIDINKTGDINKINECIKYCKLEKFVKSLPDGIDTNIGEEINKISEGEKLRICLARTLYKDSEILLLDEITAALDSINSVEIEKMIATIDGKLIINICHKFVKSVLPLYDEIVIVEGGEVVLSGSYDEIKENGLFAKYVIQANMTD